LPFKKSKKEIRSCRITDEDNNYFSIYLNKKVVESILEIDFETQTWFARTMFKFILVNKLETAT
jgi:hypothetical protein